MNSSMIDKLSQVNLSNGKFVSDKSYAYDTIYFIAKFIIDYQENGFFDLAKWRGTLIDYIAEKWQLLDKNDGILNYYFETVSLLEYSKVIEKSGNNLKIIDFDLLKYITKNHQMENAYIFIYLLCYYTLKNSNCYDSYIKFCNANSKTEKNEYVLDIYYCLCRLNVSIRNPDLHDQWSKQNTQYIMNILNFINHEPWVTREFTFDYTKTYKPEMISVNVKGTKTKYPKKNEYLQEFNYMYVIENLNDYIVKKGVE